MPSSKHRQAGLTLLEILVALAVFATAAVSIISTISATAVVVENLEQKTFAHYVAGNKLAEMSLKDWPRIGVTLDEHEMANRTWFSQTKVEATARPDMRIVRVEVRLDKNDELPLVTRVAFVGNLPK
jgi:general secretion pathway protein I